MIFFHPDVFFYYIQDKRFTLIFICCSKKKYRFSIKFYRKNLVDKKTVLIFAASLGQKFMFYF